MPEGPEVRKYADALDRVLSGRKIKTLSARTRNARLWLAEHGASLKGQRVLSVRSHGKHLVGLIEGDFYFHSHLMMWGRWQTFTPGPPPEIDRRERARIVVTRGAAVLYSAPIFNVGQGDPINQVEHLNTLGPDVLPYNGNFDDVEFLKRLLTESHRQITIGAALLNQQILAGLGNYLRAEVLFHCKINPWRKIFELTVTELDCISRAAPGLARRSYDYAGVTATDEDRLRMSNDSKLVYQAGREYGTRHMVFRRTNLPCLRCGQSIRQQRQTTHNAGEEQRDRIVYFCANCQAVDPPDRKQS